MKTLMMTYLSNMDKSQNCNSISTRFIFGLTKAEKETQVWRRMIARLTKPKTKTIHIVSQWQY